MAVAAQPTEAAGILPDHAIEAFMADGTVAAAHPFAAAQVQPASLDLRLGARAYRVRASFLPGPDASVADRLEALTLHEIDLTAGAVLETGCVYVAPLQEAVSLPGDVAASANPKSSTGRIDVFTRLLADRSGAFDQVPAGYAGPLFLEISPRTFPIVAREGSRLSQLRFRRGEARLTDGETRALHEDEALADGEAEIDGGLAVSIDLEGGDGLLGYRAKRHTGVVDVDKPGVYDARDFWEPIAPARRAELILDPGEFYILVSREAVHVPPTHAAEMMPFDPLVGEFRVHYAGFFDPGFGHADAGGGGSRAVLEVRSRDVPFILEHGQTVARLVYERMASRPRALYGGAASNYQGQALKLSKHFR